MSQYISLRVKFPVFGCHVGDIKKPKTVISEEDSIKGAEASKGKVGDFFSKKACIKFHILNWATRLVRRLFQKEMAARRKALTSGQMLWFGSTLALAENECQTGRAFQKWKRQTSSQVFPGRNERVFNFLSCRC